MTVGPLAVRAERANVVLGKQGLEFDLDSMIRFATKLFDEGMVPKGVKGPGAVVALMEAGRELGLAPMAALSNLTFINGRLGIMGDGAKALIRSHKVLKPGTDFVETYSGSEGTEEFTCTVTAHRAGQPEPFSRSFSIADAVAAKLVRISNAKILAAKGGDEAPWATYTRRMMMYRALGFLCRDFFSDILLGAVLMEELRDYPRQERETEAPDEPDPLLALAVQSSAPDTVVEGEIVVRDEIQETLPTPTVQAAQQPIQPPTIGDDEATAIRHLEKLEGDIVSAESREALLEVWGKAAPLLNSLGAAQRKRISKLYDQNMAGFDQPK